MLLPIDDLFEVLKSEKLFLGLQLAFVVARAENVLPWRFGLDVVNQRG